MMHNRCYPVCTLNLYITQPTTLAEQRLKMQKEEGDVPAQQTCWHVFRRCQRPE
jgi:hypothetical protein